MSATKYELYTKLLTSFIVGQRFVFVFLLLMIIISCGQKKKPCEKQHNLRYNSCDTAVFTVNNDSVFQQLEIQWSGDTIISYDFKIRHIDNDDEWAAGMGAYFLNEKCRHTSEKYYNHNGEESTVNKYWFVQPPDEQPDSTYYIVIKVEENRKFAVIDSFLSSSEMTDYFIRKKVMYKITN